MERKLKGCEIFEMVSEELKILDEVRRKNGGASEKSKGATSRDGPPHTVARPEEVSFSTTICQ